MTRVILAVMVALVVSLSAAAQSVSPPSPMPLWPSTPPGAPNVPANEQERDVSPPNADRIAGRPVARTGFVAIPTLTFFPAPASHNSRATVVVFPGGGYELLAYDLEGTEVCAWLNGIGVNCALVKYRVPDAGLYPAHTEDLADAQRAVRLVRSHAAAWQVDPARVGVLGFSAGGHLVAALNAHAADAVYPAADAADRQNARPDFAILIYPAYLITQQNPGADAVKPTALTPPCFLVQAEDDGVDVGNSLTYYRELRDAKVPAEMHLYAKGGHGYGLRPTALPVTHWPALAATWLHTLGMITP